MRHAWIASLEQLRTQGAIGNDGKKVLDFGAPPWYTLLMPTHHQVEVILADIKEEGEALQLWTDAIYHDDILEQAIPDVVRRILLAEDPRVALVQVFDIITRLVEDPPDFINEPT